MVSPCKCQSADESFLHYTLPAGRIGVQLHCQYATPSYGLLEILGFVQPQPLVKTFVCGHFSIIDRAPVEYLMERNNGCEVAAKKRQFCVHTHNNKNIEREWLTLSAFLTTVFQQTGAISKMSDKIGEFLKCNPKIPI